MEITIDAAGRVVIPKELRVKAAIQPGMPVEARYEDGRIVLEPKPVPMRVVQRGRFIVAIPETRTEPLTAEAVEKTRRKVRHERTVGED